MEIIITGILLGGAYALIAVGLTIQYGVARIMNLATGETLVAGCFCAYWIFNSLHINPILGIFLIIPAAFVLNWAVYSVLLLPLVRRAKNRAMLEVDSILATFGILFLMEGLMLVGFGGEYFSYTFLSEPFTLFGSVYGLNRIVAFLAAVLITGTLYVFLNHTRYGTTIRAVAADPASAGLVAINVDRVAAFSFALGGVVTAAGGALLSTFYTFNASMGMLFTMKALIIVIMGGVGDVRGAVIAALILGIAETATATLVDPGLTIAATYLLFIIILLFRPQGLFGRQSA